MHNSVVTREHTGEVLEGQLCFKDLSKTAELDSQSNTHSAHKDKVWLAP